MENNEVGAMMETTEVEKDGLMLEMIDGLSKNIEEIDRFKETERDEKVRLDEALIEAKNQEGVDMVAEHLEKQIDEESDLRLLIDDLKVEMTPLSLSQLREKIFDANISKQEKIDLLEEVGNWYRRTQNTLGELSPCLGKVWGKVKSEYLDISESTDESRELESEFDRYTNSLMEKVKELEEHTDNMYSLWRSKLEEVRH